MLKVLHRAVLTGFWLVLLSVGAISAVELYRLSRLHLRAGVPTHPVIAGSTAISPAVCLTYPHALIRCGLSSEDELEGARENDAQLREHYADVGFVRPEVLKSDELDYVSYRMGSKIVWTSKRLPIHAGETVLKDRYGNAIRGRCGNRLSQVPMMPEAPDLPPDMEFERPSITGLLPFVPEAPPALAPVVPDIPMEVPPLPPYVVEAPPVEAKGPWPFVPFIPLIPIIPIAEGWPLGGTPIGGGPVIPVLPEPGTVWLSVGALALLAGGRSFRSRTQQR